MKTFLIAAICISVTLAKRKWPHLAPDQFEEKDNFYNSPRLEAIHEIVNKWPNDGTSFKHDPEVADENQPMEMTPELYEAVQTNSTGLADRPWLIVFGRKERSQEQFYHSDFIINTMKILGDDYQGAVRFAWSDVIDDEILKETYEIYAVPQNFLCLPQDGRMMCHEMHAMSLGYLPVRKFIEGGYKDKKEVYQSFEMPKRIPEIMLYWKYIIKDFTKDIYNPYLSKGQQWAKDQGYYESFPENLKTYLDTEPITKQAKVLLAIGFGLAFIMLWIMIKWCCCFLRCVGCNCPYCFFCCGCCSKKLAYPDKVREKND